MICGQGDKQKLKYPYPRDSKIIQIPYQQQQQQQNKIYWSQIWPRAKAINQNPALCPASPPPPAGLTLIGALLPQYGVNNYCILCTVKAKKANKHLQQRTLSGFITIPLY